MPPLRIGIGRLWHESNTFSDVATNWSCFDSYEGGVRIGQAMLRNDAQNNECVGMRTVLNRQGNINIVPLFSAAAIPSGSITRDAADRFEKLLRDQLRSCGPLDGICFSLHGAMSAEGTADYDGRLLQIIREETASRMPLVVSLDCHAVVSDQMLKLADAMVAYRTHPHIDLMETGSKAASILLKMLQDHCKPMMHAVKIPLMFSPPDEGTHAGALKEIFDTFTAWDALPDVLACSFCPGFPWQDVPGQGATAIAVTDNDPALAEQLANELALQVWKMKDALQPAPLYALSDAIDKAACMSGAPVILIDSADTVGGGAPGDNTCLLEGLLKYRQQVDGLILTHLPSPRAVDELFKQKNGDTVTVTVGGERDQRFCQPCSVTGRLAALEQGPISDDGCFGTEPFVQTGRIARIDIQQLCLVLTERVVLGPQPSLYRKVGVDPFKAKIVALKTGVGYRATFGDVAAGVIRADCPGATSYDLTRFEYRCVPRPIEPLDRDFTWKVKPSSSICSKAR